MQAAQERGYKARQEPVSGILFLASEERRKKDHQLTSGERKKENRRLPHTWPLYLPQALPLTWSEKSTVGLSLVFKELLYAWLIPSARTELLTMCVSELHQAGAATHRWQMTNTLCPSHLWKLSIAANRLALPSGTVASFVVWFSAQLCSAQSSRLLLWVTAMSSLQPYLWAPLGATTSWNLALCLLVCPKLPILIDRTAPSWTVAFC